MKKNITNKILMVRPVSFTFNEETAVNNHYQKKDNKPIQEIQNNALTEFDNMVEKLKKIFIFFLLSVIGLVLFNGSIVKDRIIRFTSITLGILFILFWGVASIS